MSDDFTGNPDNFSAFSDGLIDISDSSSILSDFMSSYKYSKDEDDDIDRLFTTSDSTPGQTTENLSPSMVTNPSEEKEILFQWALLTYLTPSPIDTKDLICQITHMSRSLTPNYLITTSKAPSMVFTHVLLICDSQPITSTSTSIFALDSQIPLVISDSTFRDHHVERAYKFCLQDATVEVDRLKHLPPFRGLRNGAPEQGPLYILSQERNQFNTPYIRDLWSVVPDEKKRGVVIANRIGGMHGYVSTGRVHRMRFSERVGGYLRAGEERSGN